MLKKLIGLGAATLLVSSVALAKPPKKTPELLKKGEQLFSVTCASCHGAKGEGDGPAAIALDPKPRSFVKDEFKNGDKPAQVFKSISEGFEGSPMVAFRHLPEEDRWALTYKVLELRKAKKKKKK